jgi:bifunctional UDP-N-acetylglucosamine pyrophosphorylase/glucosamine-1-phosphate N-acetyltransferase
MPEVERIAVVLSPTGVAPFETTLSADEMRVPVSIAVQERATGMGDAIFAAWPIWRDYGSILVIWGDQANLSASTVKLTLEAHRQATRGVTIPLVRKANPYVQYDFDGTGRLCRIRQSREHDIVDAEGYNDVGIFALHTDGLYELWCEYRSSCVQSRITGEINFLPFLVFLAQQAWPIRIVPAGSEDETHGINTAEELAFARRRFMRAMHAVTGG